MWEFIQISLPSLQVRLNSEQERFLIVPFGLLYSEVTASSLVTLPLFFPQPSDWLSKRDWHQTINAYRYYYNTCRKMKLLELS